MPDFDRFRNAEGGADLGNRFDDGFDDGFDDDFSDDFGGGSADDPDDGRNKGFDEPTGEEFHDGTMFFDDNVRVSDQSGGEAESDWRSGSRAGREKADLKDAFAALFRSIADRFTGKGKHVRATGLDGSDASFASEFDSAVDEGFAAPPSDPVYPSDAYGEPFPEAGGTPDAPFRDEVAEAYRLPPQEERQQPCYDGEYAQAPFSAAPQENYDLLPDDGDFMPEQGREAWDNAPDEGEIESPDGVEEALPPDGSAGGVFAALADALRKFCRRLPSFRPKVYVPPEPDYHPEDDGIGTPSLASDITRLLEEQNKPGETEQEYDRMRQYISTVSTDTRIRPGDIRQPDNIEEVRAAEDELYSLIASISDTNEQQRRRIGVYEKPPEEDPYNYRGINDDRQYFTDMEAYSFNMNSRYGFESEEKVDPRRQQIETEYSRVYNRAVSQQPYDGGFDDGFDDDFTDDTGGFSGQADGGFDEGFDDDFTGDTGGFPGQADRGDGSFNDGFDDDFDAPAEKPQPETRGSRVRVRRYANPDANASVREGFSHYRAKRSTERRNTHRRRNG